MTVLGVDQFLQKHLSLVKGKKIGLLAHGASVTSTFKWVPQVFSEHDQVDLVQLFGPEHGVFGTAQDMEGVENCIEPITGIPVASLYGRTVESLKPKENDLKTIDVLVCDLQDVGTRFYTYVYTMAFCLEACAKMNIPVIVLDRPNPLGGDRIEGNVLTDLSFRSFVGWYSLPVRHGMTIGELAKMWNATENFNCDLTVIPMQNWKRSFYYDQTGLRFVPPSPNMPTLDTALVYPGGCLIEATEVSEGRGTTMPFEWMGAPYMNAGILTEELNGLNLSGVHFRPFHFKPSFQKWAGQECCGVQLHVTDRQNYDSYTVGLYVIQTMKKLFPEFSWREKAYEFVEDIPAIDLLVGGSWFRETLEDKASIQQHCQQFAEQCQVFAKDRKEFLLY